MPLPPHDYLYYRLKSDHFHQFQVKTRQSDKVTNVKKKKKKPKIHILRFYNKCNTWHTFWICLIRCINMKWIQWVLKIQIGHDSVHGRTDGRKDRWTDGPGETRIPLFQLGWSRLYNVSIGSHNGLVPKRLQAIIWINNELVQNRYFNCQ